jgi:hypothetical protein
MTGMLDFDEYCEQAPLVVTFEPLAYTWLFKMGDGNPNPYKPFQRYIPSHQGGLEPRNLEPISLGVSLF